jgi:hypothetical protein
MTTEKFNPQERPLKSNVSSEWVQEATLYIPPTSHVLHVDLPFEEPNFEQLRRAARPNLVRRLGSAVVNTFRRPQVVRQVEHHHHYHDSSEYKDDY